MLNYISRAVLDDTNNIIYRVSYGPGALPPIISRDNISMMLPETSGTAKLTVTSGAFAPGAAIPDKHSAYFEGISPALSWSGAPAGTKSFVLMMEDPDAALKPVTHWIMANISPRTTTLPENVLKSEKFGPAAQGANITGKPGYYGPKPPHPINRTPTISRSSRLIRSSICRSALTPRRCSTP